MYAAVVLMTCLTQVQNMRSSHADVEARAASDPLMSLAVLLTAANPSATWTAPLAGLHSSKRPSSAVSASRHADARFSTVTTPEEALDTAIDVGSAKAELGRKLLEDEMISSSLLSWRAGRFGSGDRYANMQQPCMDLVERLESEFQGEDLDMDNLRGRWQLIFTNDSVTRSSPFFWVLKEMFETDPVSHFFDRSSRVKASTDLFSKAYFKTLDIFLYGPMSVGEAYQEITDTELVSEVDLRNLVGAFVMTTTSTLDSIQGRVLELTMKTTQAVKGNIDDFLPDIVKMGNVKFPSGLMFERIKPGITTVRAEVTYLSDELRVTRHQNNVYVHRKIS
mmetsp:Transcript_73621/g.127755  ORF Transcript_73621/g.127755 Transcript_73621/m.127755 type:complete len:336 (+) Transcript_73621:69-1076(+)